MKNNNLDISHTTYSIIDENKNYISKRVARNFFKLDDLLKSCDIGTSTVVIKRYLFNDGLLFPALKTKEDFVLWLNILKKNIKIYSLNEDLSMWRQSKYSLSSSTTKKLIDCFKVYYKYMNFNYFKSLYYLLCLSLNYLIKK